MSQSGVQMLLLLAGLLAGFSIRHASAQSSGKGCAAVSGYRAEPGRHLTDSLGGQLSGKSASEVARLCEANAQCVGFRYDPSDRTAFLKTVISPNSGPFKSICLYTRVPKLPGGLARQASVTASCRASSGQWRLDLLLEPPRGVTSSIRSALNFKRLADCIKMEACVDQSGQFKRCGIPSSAYIIVAQEVFVTNPRPPALVQAPSRSAAILIDNAPICLAGDYCGSQLVDGQWKDRCCSSAAKPKCCGLRSCCSADDICHNGSCCAPGSQLCTVHCCPRGSTCCGFGACCKSGENCLFNGRCVSLFG